MGKTKGQKTKPSELDRKIGLNIKLMRISRGEKQRDIAEYLNISTQQYQKYESGKTKVSVGILLKLVKYFEKPISYFFGDEQ